LTGSPQVLQAETFGAMLRMLRRKARLTQVELGIQVGYSEAHISRLEGDQRKPDPVIVATRFIPALILEQDPEAAARLVELADLASGGKLEDQHFSGVVTQEHSELEEVGALEMIPAPPSLEVERGEPLEKLGSIIESQGSAALVGMPGIGKTTLAANLARAFRGPVFWFTVTPMLASPLEALIRQLALFLLLEGKEQVSFLLGKVAPGLALDQQVNVIASALATTACLLCIDDVHELKDEAAWNALGRWQRIEGVTILYISREALPGSGTMSVRLDGMELEESHELIRGLTDDAERILVERLHGLTAGNPMLMRLALSQVVSNGANFMDDLALEPTVSAYILDTMLKDLQTDTRRLISWLSLFRTPVDLYQPAVGKCLQEIITPPGVVGEAIDEARRRQLIDHPNQAVLHPLIASHIQHRLTSEPDERCKLHRAAADCCMTGATGDAIEAAYHLAQAGEIEQVVDWLTDQVGDLRNRGQTGNAARVVEQVLEEDASLIKDASLKRRLLALLGDLLVNTARAGEAEQYYRQALDLTPRQEVGPVAWAQLALRLANSLMQRTQVQEAADLLQQAMDALGAGSPLVRSQLAASMARAQLMTTQLDSAEQSARDVLKMVKEIELFAPQAAAEAGASAYSMLGIILRIRRDYSSSIEAWQQAIREARRGGKLEIEYRSMVNLAGTYYEQGELERALEVSEEARTGLLAIGDSYALARLLNTMAILHHVRGELEPAIERAQEACELKLMIGDTQGWANSEAMRGLLLLNLGRIDDGRQALEAVVEATRDTGEQRAQAIYLDSLGLAQTLSGAADQGEKTLTGALALDVAGEDNRLRGNLENHLAQAYLAQGKLDLAASIADSPAPEGAGPEVDVERGMVQVMLALAIGNVAQAQERGKRVAGQAEQGGYILLNMLTRQLMAIEPNSTSLAELPYWGWVLQNDAPPE
jgi:tetratricopeptide (TPR) repeat protein/transcriptional regulator with XRE-family HTH domain